MCTVKEQQTETNPIPKPTRSVSETLFALDQLVEKSVSLVRKPLPAFLSGGHEFHIPRYLFIGPKGGAEPIRVGFFAGAHGDEPEGTFALLEFIERLEQTPVVSKDYCLFLYPILNPSGFEAGSRNSRDGVNIPNEIWKNTASPEVQHLQSELWMHGFDGIVSLKTDPVATDLTIAIGGPIFARHLLGSAISSAQDLLPQRVNSTPKALPKWKSVLLDEPNDLIRAAPGLKPRPFEIVITIPRQAPTSLQKAAVSLLLQTVLIEYRNFISYGANI